MHLKRLFSGQANQGVCVPLEPGGVASGTTGRPVQQREGLYEYIRQLCRRGVSSSRPSGQTMMLKVIIFSNHVKYEILGTWKYKCVCTMQCQEQTSLEIKNYPCNIKPVI